MIGKTLSHYQINGEIGFGGMGAVYRAKDVRTDQQVAIKLLPPEYLDDMGFRAGFAREALLVSGLKHEAIVPVYEFGEQDGQPFIAMQFMPNGSLADRLVQGSVPPEEVASILERLSGAIDYAHGQGVNHRDLKPSNILFDEENLPYLADFGIASQVAAARQTGPLVSGTPAYLSPEQASGESNIDSRSDIYGLGIILFEMLTSRLPFSGETTLAIILMQIHDMPPSLREVNPGLPSALDEVIQRALAKKPEDRYPTSGELADAFRQALEHPGFAAPQIEETVPADSSLDTGRIMPPSTGFDQGDETAPVPASGSEILLQPEGISADNAASRGGNGGGWRGMHFLSLCFTALLGVMVAATLVAFTRNFPPNGTPGILLTYDGAAINLTNKSGVPVDLSGVAFRRITADGTATAAFPAFRWILLSGSAPLRLKPEACYQLLRAEVAPLKLKPGSALPIPNTCRKLQSWLVDIDQDWLFWIPEGNSTSFQVINNGQLIQTCSIASGSCEFTLTQP